MNRREFLAGISWEFVKMGSLTVAGGSVGAMVTYGSAQQLVADDAKRLAAAYKKAGAVQTREQLVAMISAEQTPDFLWQNKKTLLQSTLFGAALGNLLYERIFSPDIVRSPDPS